ncbi:hypothetical protein GGQ84_002848 [Desulfitispora alkaliphila]|uniref:hypothetical protein n=1 Tax=Desulfitispora alkaliphila TaxID=622674 RepID=UPI003D253384
MLENFSEELLKNVATECSMFESIAQVQGFGASIAALSGDEQPQCDNCVHWLASTCSIFRSELYSMRD